MKVLVLLADYAQVSDGKLYVIGGGWTLTGPGPSPMALAIQIEVAWGDANRIHNWRLELQTTDGQIVAIPGQVGPQPLSFSGTLEAGRPPGHPRGAPLSTCLAVNLQPIPLDPGKRFVWKFFFNDRTEDNWQATFSTRPIEKA